MGFVSVSILLIDDFEPWRRLVSSILKPKLKFQTICEVSDGLEAVWEAGELQPNLILLDIGLPTLNGIEAARRIRKVAPEAKIVFLSQKCSAYVVQEALDLGAQGYVVKSDAASELLTAMNTVLRGKKFVSTRLAYYDSTDTRDTRGCIRTTD